MGSKSKPNGNKSPASSTDQTQTKTKSTISTTTKPAAPAVTTNQQKNKSTLNQAPNKQQQSRSQQLPSKSVSPSPTSSMNDDSDSDDDEIEITMDGNNDYGQDSSDLDDLDSPFLSKREQAYLEQLQSQSEFDHDEDEDHEGGDSDDRPRVPNGPFVKALRLHNPTLAFESLIHPLELDDFMSTYHDRKEIALDRGEENWFDGLFDLTGDFLKEAMVREEECKDYSTILSQWNATTFALTQTKKQMDKAEEEYYMNEKAISLLESKMEQIKAHTLKNDKNAKNAKNTKNGSKNTDFEEPFPFPASSTTPKGSKSKLGSAVKGVGAGAGASGAGNVLGTSYRDAVKEMTILRQKSEDLEAKITTLDDEIKALTAQKQQDREQKASVEVPSMFKWDVDVNVSTFGGDVDLNLNPTNNPTFSGSIYPAIKARLFLLDTAARAKINAEMAEADEEEKGGCCGGEEHQENGGKCGEKKCTDKKSCSDKKKCKDEQCQDENCQDESDAEDPFEVTDADLEHAALEALANAVMEESLAADYPKEEPNLQDELDMELLGLSFGPQNGQNNDQNDQNPSPTPSDPDNYPDDLHLFRGKSIEQLYGLITELYNQKKLSRGQVKYHQLCTFLRAGCNLLLSHPQRFCTKIWRLLWLIETQFRTLVDAHVQVIPKHSMGTAKRYNSDEMFILQLDGTTNLHLYDLKVSQNDLSVPNLVNMINESQSGVGLVGAGTEADANKEHAVGIQGPFYQHESIDALTTQIPKATQSLKKGDFLYLPPHSVHQVVPTLEPTLVYAGDVDEFNQMQIQDKMEAKRAKGENKLQNENDEKKSKQDQISQFLPPFQQEDSVYLIVTFPHRVRYEKLYKDAFQAALDEVMRQNTNFQTFLPPHFSTYLGTIHDDELELELDLAREEDNGIDIDMDEDEDFQNEEEDEDETPKSGQNGQNGQKSSKKSKMTKFGDIELDEEELAEFKAMMARGGSKKGGKGGNLGQKPSKSTLKSSSMQDGGDDSEEYRYSDLSDDFPSDDEEFMSKIGGKKGKMNRMGSKPGKISKTARLSTPIDLPSPLNDEDDNEHDLGFDLTEEIPPYVMSDNFTHLHRKWLMVGNMHPEFRSVLKKFRQNQVFDQLDQLCLNFRGQVKSHLHQVADQISIEFNQNRLPPPPIEDEDESDDEDNDEDNEDEDGELYQDEDQDEDCEDISFEELEAMEAMNPTDDSEAEDSETDPKLSKSKQSTKSSSLQTPQNVRGQVVDDQDEDNDEDGEGGEDGNEDDESGGYNPDKAVKLTMNSRDQIISSKSTILASTLGAVNRRELEMQYGTPDKVSDFMELILAQLDSESGIRLAYPESLLITVEQSQAKIDHDAENDDEFENDHEHYDELLEMENDEDFEDEDEDEEDFDQVSPQWALDKAKPQQQQKQQQKQKQNPGQKQSSKSQNSSKSSSADVSDIAQDEEIDGYEPLPGEELFPATCGCGEPCEAYQLYCSQLSRSVSLPHASKCVAFYNSNDNKRDAHMKFWDEGRYGSEWESPIKALFDSDQSENEDEDQDEDVEFDDLDEDYEEDEEDEDFYRKPQKTSALTSKFSKLGGGNKRSFQSTMDDSDSSDETGLDGIGCATGTCIDPECPDGSCTNSDDPHHHHHHDDDEDAENQEDDGSGRIELPIAILPMVKMLQEEYPRLLPIADLDLDWKAVSATSSGFMTQIPLDLVHRLNEYKSKEQSQGEDDDDFDNQPSERFAMLYKMWAICELFVLGLIEIVPSDTYEINAMLAEEGPDAEEDDDDDILFANDEEEDEQEESGPKKNSKDAARRDAEMIKLLNMKNEMLGKTNQLGASGLKKDMKSQKTEKPTTSKSSKLIQIQDDEEGEDEADINLVDFEGDYEGELDDLAFGEGEFDDFFGQEGEFDDFGLGEGEFDQFDHDEDEDDMFGADTSDDESLTQEEVEMSKKLKKQLVESALHKVQAAKATSAKPSKAETATKAISALDRLKATQKNKWGASDDEDEDNDDEFDPFGDISDSDLQDNGEGELNAEEIMQLYGNFDGKDKWMLDLLDADNSEETLDLAGFDFGPMVSAGKKQTSRAGLKNAKDSEDEDEDDFDEDFDEDWSDDEGAADGAMIWEESGSDYGDYAGEGDSESDFDDMWASEGDVEDLYWRRLNDEAPSEPEDIWGSDGDGDIWGSEDEVQLPAPVPKAQKMTKVGNKMVNKKTGFSVEVVDPKEDAKKTPSVASTKATKATTTVAPAAKKVTKVVNETLSTKVNPQKRKIDQLAHSNNDSDDEDASVRHVSKKTQKNPVSAKNTQGANLTQQKKGGKK